jgi:hypothetical protein
MNKKSSFCFFSEEEFDACLDRLIKGDMKFCLRSEEAECFC